MSVPLTNGRPCFSFGRKHLWFSLFLWVVLCKHWCGTLLAWPCIFWFRCIQRLSFSKASASRPCKASSAGFCLVTTCFHCGGDVTSCMAATRFSMKVWDHPEDRLIDWCTDFLHDHSVPRQGIINCFSGDIRDLPMIKEQWTSPLLLVRRR